MSDPKPTGDRPIKTEYRLNVEFETGSIETRIRIQSEDNREIDIDRIKGLRKQARNFRKNGQAFTSNGWMKINKVWIEKWELSEREEVVTDD